MKTEITKPEKSYIKVKSKNCYNYQKLKTKLTESKVPKRATYKITNSGTPEPTNSRTHELTNPPTRSQDNV